MIKTLLMILLVIFIPFNLGADPGVREPSLAVLRMMMPGPTVQSPSSPCTMPSGAPHSPNCHKPNTFCMALATQAWNIAISDARSACFQCVADAQTEYCWCIMSNSWTFFNIGYQGTSQCFDQFTIAKALCAWNMGSAMIKADGEYQQAMEACCPDED